MRNGNRQIPLPESIPADNLLVVLATQLAIHYSEETLCVTILQGSA